mgnify:FL=1
MSPGPTMERVYLELKARLLSNEFPPGTRLGPAELAKLLDASPTPVRDALYRLSGERIVESWHLEGFRQPLLTEADLQDLYGWTGTLLGLALRGRTDVAEPGSLFELPRSEAYPGGVESLFRTIGAGATNRELRHAIGNLVERAHLFRELEARIDAGAANALEAMQEDYRFARWTALRSKITNFHRARIAQAGRVIAELRPRAEPLR